jgi:phosphatidylglycerophosphate synthase
MSEKQENSNNKDQYKYEESLKEKKENLLNKIVKVEKYFHRPLAGLMVKAIFNTSITPNQVSVFSFLLGLLAIFFFTRGTYLNFILGGIFTLLSSLVDCADGQLARAKNLCSNYGAQLDIFFDRIIDFFLLAAISYGVYIANNDINLLVIGMTTAGLYLLQITLYHQTKQLLQNEKTGETSEAHSLLLLLMCLFALFNKLDIFIYLMLAETIFVNLYRFWNFIRLKKVIEP